MRPARLHQRDGFGAMFRRPAFGHQHRAGGPFAAQSESDDGSPEDERAKAGGQGRSAGADGIDQDGENQSAPPSDAVRKKARADAAQRGGDQRGGADQTGGGSGPMKFGAQSLDQRRRTAGRRRNRARNPPWPPIARGRAAPEIQASGLPRRAGAVDGVECGRADSKISWTRGSGRRLARREVTGPSALRSLELRPRKAQIPWVFERIRARREPKLLALPLGCRVELKITIGIFFCRYRCRTVWPPARGMFRSRMINRGWNSGALSIFRACSPSLATRSFKGERNLRQGNLGPAAHRRDYPRPRNTSIGSIGPHFPYLYLLVRFARSESVTFGIPARPLPTIAVRVLSIELSA